MLVYWRNFNSAKLQVVEIFLEEVESICKCQGYILLERRSKKLHLCGKKLRKFSHHFSRSCVAEKKRER